ncbi:hypothetical protein C8R45DRAFT_1152112 [Mycena sanguinolenta]|nr:hypothetical protein C8R45DRAFT_1152112 [Mycena sanguinolenta]
MDHSLFTFACQVPVITHENGSSPRNSLAIAPLFSSFSTGLVCTPGSCAKAQARYRARNQESERAKARQCTQDLRSQKQKERLRREQSSERLRSTALFACYKLHVRHHMGSFCGRTSDPEFMRAWERFRYADGLPTFNSEDALFLWKYDAPTPCDDIPSAEEIERSLAELRNCVLFLEFDWNNEEDVVAYDHIIFGGLAEMQEEHFEFMFFHAVPAPTMEKLDSLMRTCEEEERGAGGRGGTIWGLDQVNEGALEEKSDDDETDGKEFHPPKSSFFLEPDTGSDTDEEQKRPVSVFLDIAAEDSDEEGDDGEGDLEETLSDQEFLDDTPQQQSTHPPRPISRPHAAEEHDNTLALARYYERWAEEEGYGDSDRGRASKPKAPALPAVEPALSRGAPTSRLQPIQTATWVHGCRSVYKGKILFILSPCKVLYVPNSEESWIRFRDKKKFKQRAKSGFMITNKGRKPWTNLSYKRVHRPSRQDLLPYYRCTHLLLLALRCDWPTPAFAEPRARVIAANGPHKGRAGIILHLVDEEENGVIVKCADVQRIDTDPTGTGCPFRVRLDHLERHELNPCYRFRLHDRVRVVDGALYDGLLGHVLELQDQPVLQVDEDEEVIEKVTQYASMIVGVPLDCDVIDLSEPSPRWPGLKTFEIPISFAMREFHLGDLVEVKVGEHTGRIGVIVVLEGARWVRICDVKDFASVLIETPALDFYHETSDLLLLMAPQQIESARNPEIGDVVRVKQEKYISRVGTLVAVHDQNSVDGQNLLELKDHTHASTHFYVKAAEVELSSASSIKYRAGRRFEGIEVQVKCSRFKGLRGAVVGDHDSQARVERLDSKNKHAWVSPEDSKGIMLSIGKERSNEVVENVPIEQVVHELLSTMLPLSQARWLPKKILCGQTKPRVPPSHRGAFPNDEPPVQRPPTPPNPIGAEPFKISGIRIFRLARIFTDCDEGEDDGQWLSMPDLADKHLDVKVVGLPQLPVCLSKVMLDLEGTFCHVLIGVPPVSSNDKVVEVCGAGRTFRKFKIDQSCIKPGREGDDKERLAQVETRVVVIRPDIMFEGTRLGQYGQTVPSWRHHYGEGVVPVHFEEGVGGFFHESSLCMARNVKIMKDNKLFNVTTFPPDHNIECNLAVQRIKMYFTLAGTRRVPCVIERRRRKRFDALKRVKARPPKSESAGAKRALRCHWILRVENPDGTAHATLNCLFCAAREDWRALRLRLKQIRHCRMYKGASPSKTWSAANVQEGQRVARRVQKHARPPPPNSMRAALFKGRVKAGTLCVPGVADLVQGNGFDALHDHKFVRRCAGFDSGRATLIGVARELLLQRRKDFATASAHGEVGACPIWVAEGFDNIVLYLPGCPTFKGVFEQCPGGRGWNATMGINWVVDGSRLVYESSSEAGRVWRYFEKHAMVLATPHWSVACEHIHEIIGEHPKLPEDLDLMDYMAEQENRQEAWVGNDEWEDEMLKDDEDT